MKKKFAWLYRLLIWIAVILIGFHILVKAIVWPAALLKKKDGYCYSIQIRKHFNHVRYTTENGQKLFNAVDYLLTPAFITIFLIVTIKLSKKAELLVERTERD